MNSAMNLVWRPLVDLAWPADLHQPALSMTAMRSDIVSASRWSWVT
jgi:hypothetical protein